MARRILNFFNLFHRELSGIHQAAFLLASAGLTAKILALLRDRLLASSFGAGKVLDIYYAAFRLPDFIYTLSLFFVAATALIPIFLEKFSQDEKKSREFFNSVFTMFLLVIILLVMASFLTAPFLNKIIAPGFSSEDQLKLLGLTRILLLSPLLLGLSSLVSAVIQSFNRFFIYALSPILYNFGIILGVLVFYPFLGTDGLAWGVALGALFHFLIQIPSLFKLGFFPKFSSKIITADIRKVLKFSCPRTVGLTMNQAVFWLITALASSLAAGSIAVFNLAYNLQTIPVTLIGLSYSVAAFPALSKFFAKNERSKFLLNVLTAGRHIIFWSLPVSVIFIVLRAHIVRLILGAGAFSWVDTRLTAAGLAVFSVSITAQGLILLFVRAFYAAGKTKRPLIINLISSGAIILGALAFPKIIFSSDNLKFFFASVLRVSDLSEITILVLVSAFSLGSIINAVLLAVYFKKDLALSAEARFSERRRGALKNGFLKSFLEILFAGLVMGFLIYVFLRIFESFFDVRTFLGLLGQAFFSGLLGAGGWFAVLVLLKNGELKEILSALKKKFWKAPVVASEPEQLP